MRCISFTTMILSLHLSSRHWLRVLCLASMLATGPLFGAEPPASTSEAVNRSAPGDKDAIVSTTPMKIEADSDAGAHGQLVVASELSSDSRSDLVYTITTEPAHGQVGLAGGDDADFFKNHTSHSGYFAYRPTENFAGEDSFAY